VNKPQKLQASDFVDYTMHGVFGVRVVSRQHQMREMRKNLQHSLRVLDAEMKALPVRRKNVYFQLMELEALMRSEGMLRVQVKRRRR
jgi:hypothetical protein